MKSMVIGDKVRINEGTVEIGTTTEGVILADNRNNGGLLWIQLKNGNRKGYNINSAHFTSIEIIEKESNSN